MLRNAGGSRNSMPESQKRPPQRNSKLPNELLGFVFKLDSMYRGEGASTGVKKPIGGVPLFRCSSMPKLSSSENFKSDPPIKISNDEDAVESKLGNKNDSVVLRAGAAASPRN